MVEVYKSILHIQSTKFGRSIRKRKKWKEYSLELHVLLVVGRDATYFESDYGNITGSTFPTGQTPSSARIINGLLQFVTHRTKYSLKPSTIRNKLDKYSLKHMVS